AGAAPSSAISFSAAFSRSIVVTPAATTVFKWFSTWRTIFPLRLIFSISSGDLRMIRSSPELIINSDPGSGASPLASALAMPINHAENLRRNIFYRPVRIDRDQTPLHPVVIRHRLGLPLIGSQSLGNHFFAIVVPDHQLGFVHITQLVDERWLKVDVIEPSTGGTRTPPGKPQQ